MFRNNAVNQQGRVRWRRYGCRLAIACVALSVPTESAVADKPPRPGAPVVRIVYLVPADRVPRTDYVDRLTAAVEHLRIWFRNEMGDGTTFRLHAPVVEVVRSSQVASWYRVNPSGDPVVWFFNNVVTDAFLLTGARFFDPNNTWVLYVDSDPACGQLTGATSGVAVLPANDLRGLADEPNIPPCVGDPPDTAGVCRWVGGLGHELGHAFGLPHPSACVDSDPTTVCSENALMWLGYTTYPEAYLLNEDRLALTDSPFFSRIGLRQRLPDCSNLARSR